MSSAPCFPSGQHGLGSFVQYGKTYGVMHETLNRHAIFDTTATSDNCTVSSSSSYYIILSVGNDVFLPPLLSFCHFHILCGELLSDKLSH